MDEQGSEPPSQLLSLLGVDLGSFQWDALIGLFFILLLLCLSALISGAEVAFFSLTKTDVENMKSNRTGSLVGELLKRPKRLLATILITNNFVNVAIVILSSFVLLSVFPKEIMESFIGWFMQVVVITFILLLCGEIIPKIYANEEAEKFSLLMAYPIFYLKMFFYPLSELLVSTTSFIDRRITKMAYQLSVDELSHALDITAGKEVMQNEERRILEGIVNFGNTEVRQIMKPRLDVVAIDKDDTFKELMEQILDAGYSRIPVYEDNLDKVIGMIYVKDLLQYVDEKDDFNWHKLLRTPFFVPENKKIDDLLSEFQQKKIHAAVVVDEYGGTSGLVTLEDVIEEIVGDITDEFDDNEIVYSKLDDDNYVFEGKTSLNNFYKILDIDGDEFEEHKGESDSLAGFVLEIEGQIPKKNHKISFRNYVFTIESVDNKRIKRLKVSIDRTMDEEDFDDNGK